MRHVTLPDTLTPEQLGVWIAENQTEQIRHTEEIELTPEDIQQLEHKSSLASRAMDDLDIYLKAVTRILKKGTPVDAEGNPEPYPTIIPPTKGMEALEANRKFADDSIKLGKRFEHITLFGIAFPEQEKIIFVDAGGVHYPQYDRNMNPNELEKYGKPLLKAMTENSAEDLFG